MSLSVAALASVASLEQQRYIENSSPRPLKRARKGTTSRSPDRSDDRHHYVHQAPIDHIFIADGVSSKKAGGKKTPLSCCECRRLKLKCDRSFPCASCKKRGCAEICPDGVLVSGKGTRFILANTEQLHEKIHDMSDRIRQLEEALHSLHSQYAPNGNQPHPLMTPELLHIKSSMELYNGTHSPDARQGPNSRPHRAEDHLFERGRSEDAAMSVDHPHDSGSTSSVRNNMSDATMASEIIRLSHAFPISEAMSGEPNLALREYIRSRLPPREEADYLWEQARQNALWQYNPHSSSTFYPNLAYHCYSASTASLSSRRLALLFMILAVGSLVDLERSADHPDGERYHQLARASLCETSIMEDVNVETITALFYEIWYLLVFSDKKKAAEYAWGLMGLTAKLAQSIGLHRNGGKSKVIPEELEKRRSLFWELLYLDARLSLSLGRPPSLSISQMDCPRPSYIQDDACNLPQGLHYYQEWKHSCYVHCLSPVLEALSKPKLDYDTVLALDSRIREFSIPSTLRNKDLSDKHIVMQRASLSTAMEAMLLQLHRQAYIRSLSSPEQPFNRRHKCAPSAVAVFLSASRMIANVQDLFRHEPILASRILGYWSNAFSATVALCLLVSRAPFTCLSPAALQELERARLLFRSAQEICPRAQQVLPVLETMIDKANVIYDRWSNGQETPTIILRHITDEAQDLPEDGQLNTSTSNSDDPFASAHPSLAQCIAEVHQRAKALFPMRKPCQCSPTLEKACPPSHSWSAPPNVSQSPPVLPPEVPLSGLKKASSATGGFGHGNVYQSGLPDDLSATNRPVFGEGLYNNGTVLPGDGPPLSMTLPLSSKLAVVDTINFELGALSASSDQPWMSFF